MVTIGCADAYPDSNRARQLRDATLQNIQYLKEYFEQLNLFKRQRENLIDLKPDELQLKMCLLHPPLLVQKTIGEVIHDCPMTSLLTLNGMLWGALLQLLAPSRSVKLHKALAQDAANKSLNRKETERMLARGHAIQELIKSHPDDFANVTEEQIQDAINSTLGRFRLRELAPELSLDGNDALTSDMATDKKQLPYAKARMLATLKDREVLVTEQTRGVDGVPVKVDRWVPMSDEEIAAGSPYPRPQPPSPVY